MTPERLHIIGRLNGVARSEQFYASMRGLGLSVASVSAFALILTLSESWLHASVPVRTIMWWLLLGVGGAALSVMFLPSALRTLGFLPRQGPEEIALRVGQAYPEISDSLCNVLQLTRIEPSQSTLVDAAFEQTAKSSHDLDFSVIIDRRPARTALLFALMCTTVFLLGIGLLPSSLGSAWSRIVNYSTSYVPPAPFTLHVRGQHESVMRGTTSSVIITAKGVPPETVILNIRERSSGTFTQHTLRRDSGNVYSHLLTGMTQTVEFFAESPWLDTRVVSDTSRIEVIDRPLIRTMSGSVTPPSYTKLPSSRIDATNADVTTIHGSIVRLSIESNKSLRRAYIVLRGMSSDTTSADSSVVEMKIAGNSASASFPVSRSGSYSIHLVDQTGTVNADPLRAGIVSLTDSYPMIALSSPRENIQLRQTAELPIEVSVSDDFGFSALRLYYRLTASRYAEAEKKYRSADIRLPAGQTAIDVRYVWDLAKVDITPEDQYEFYLEVADNDVVRGPKTARTSTLTVRMPSLDEVFTETDKEQGEIRKEVKNIVKEAEEIRKEADQLQRELQKQQSKRQQEATWSDKKKAEDLVKRQQELEKRMDKMSERLQQMTEKLQDNKAISEETLKKYQELQKLMSEIKSPELSRMQEQMRKAMDQISPEELQQMMKNFKFNEEEFRKNLERQLSLLKRMQAEQKTDELAKRAEELARKQDELRQRTEQANPSNKAENQRLAEEQKRLQDELEKLAKESRELEQLMKEIGQDMPQEKMQQAQKDLDAQQTQQQMQKAEEQVEQGKNQDAAEQQQQASQNLQRFAQQMKNMKREMRRNSQREAMRQMQKNTEDLLQLSKQQENLREQMKGLDPNGSQMSQLAQQQQRMQESMQNIANNMMQLGQKSMSVTPDMAQELGDALESMKDAMKSMADRNGMQAMQAQSDAMKSMNGAASKMGSALSQMMQGDASGQGGQGKMPGPGEGKGMSPFQRLQQLADQQQSINSGMNQMGQGGQQLSQEQRAEMGRLAAQQGKALRALQEVEQDRQKVQGDRQPLGDLNRIAKDMEEVMSDMQTGNITSETRQRQERILSRLLDASRSMTERDYEKNRESNSGKDLDAKSPAELEFLRQRLSSKSGIEQLRQGYTADYENIIRQYFEALQRRRVAAPTP
ncbi:MAG: hypothetical protein FGM33_07460 [Candidatus Kapabacteria bacterium]|nr:hypothetical protein [Candidatus Kapabacteria bacterium]